MILWYKCFWALVKIEDRPFFGNSKAIQTQNTLLHSFDNLFLFTDKRSLVYCNRSNSVCSTKRLSSLEIFLLNQRIYSTANSGNLITICKCAPCKVLNDHFHFPRLSIFNKSVQIRSCTRLIRNVMKCYRLLIEFFDHELTSSCQDFPHILIRNRTMASVNDEIDQR